MEKGIWIIIVMFATCPLTAIVSCIIKAYFHQYLNLKKVAKDGVKTEAAIDRFGEIKKNKYDCAISFVTREDKIVSCESLKICKQTYDRFKEKGLESFMENVIYHPRNPKFFYLEADVELYEQMYGPQVKYGFVKYFFRKAKPCLYVTIAVLISCLICLAIIIQMFKNVAVFFYCILGLLISIGMAYFFNRVFLCPNGSRICCCVYNKTQQLNSPSYSFKKIKIAKPGETKEDIDAALIAKPVEIKVKGPNKI